MKITKSKTDEDKPGKPTAVGAQTPTVAKKTFKEDKVIALDEDLKNQAQLRVRMLKKHKSEMLVGYTSQGALQQNGKK